MPPTDMNCLHEIDVRSDGFVDFDIDDEISEGETDLNFNNDNFMRVEQTNDIRVDASRGKLNSDKKRVVFYQ